MRPAAVHLHIGRLVLRGFAERERYEIAAALQRELESAIAARVPAMLTRGGTHERVEAGRIALGAGARGRGVGERVARAVHGGLAG